MNKLDKETIAKLTVATYTRCIRKKNGLNPYALEG
jgi:hypothetical protein